MTLRSFCLALATALPIVLAACSSSDDDHNDDTGAPTPEQPGEPGEPGPGEPGTPQPAVLLDESFDGATLPEGWRQVSGLVQSVTVRDGSLVIDGTYNNSLGTGVALPPALAEHGNYRVDMQFTILSANNTGRWASLMYRTSASDNLEPYYQMAVRQNATASNGTELAWRENGGWTVPYTAAFGENLDPGKTYTMTLLVHGSRAQQYLDGQLLHDAELSETHLRGGLAVQTAGAVLRVDQITVKEQLEPLPSLGDVYDAPEPATGAAMAPTLVGSYTSNPADAQGASNLLLRLDAGLNLQSDSGESAGTLAQWLDRPEGHAIPVLRIADGATIDALVPLAQARNLIDLTLVSADAQLLAQAREKLPRLRTALDFTSAGLAATPADLLTVVQATNRSGSKIAILPPALLDRDSVAYLQRMLVTVWAGAVDTPATPAQAAAVLTSGVNGIVTTQVQAYAELLARLPEGTLLRKPLVVGHRGVPSLVDENTLEGAIRAYELGADAIESDIYVSSDGHVVVMHDETVDRTTNGTGRIEAMTLAQIQALSTINHGHRVPTLGEFFAEFKGKPVTQFVEIKTSNPAVIEPLRALIEQHGVQDQVIFISFVRDQLMRAREAMPEVSAGFLTDVPTGANPNRIVRQILTHTQALSSTFNPSFNGLTPAILEAAKHRGTTFWPWTYRDQAIARQHYQVGTHGLTTDYAQWFSGYAARVTLPARQTVAPGALTLTAAVQAQDGTAANAALTRFVVVEGNAPHTLSETGALQLTGPGQLVVLGLHSHEMGGGASYTIVSNPIALTVR